MRCENDSVTDYSITVPGTCRVEYGSDFGYFPVAGNTVASVHRSLSGPFNIPARAWPTVSGRPVFMAYRLQERDSLVFLVARGRKGGLTPEELALLREIARDVKRLADNMPMQVDNQPPLTSTEQEIVEALGNRIEKASTIAKRVGCDNNSSFRTALSGLVKRGVLGKASGGGYFIKAISIQPGTMS